MRLIPRVGRVLSPKQLKRAKFVGCMLLGSIALNLFTARANKYFYNGEDYNSVYIEYYPRGRIYEYANLDEGDEFCHR